MIECTGYPPSIDKLTEWFENVYIAYEDIDKNLQTILHLDIYTCVKSYQL